MTRLAKSSDRFQIGQRVRPSKVGFVNGAFRVSDIRSGIVKSANDDRVRIAWDGQTTIQAYAPELIEHDPRILSPIEDVRVRVSSRAATERMTTLLLIAKDGKWPRMIVNTADLEAILSAKK